jgi:hypothetical protein
LDKDFNDVTDKVDFSVNNTLVPAVLKAWESSIPGSSLAELGPPQLLRGLLFWTLDVMGRRPIVVYKGFYRSLLQSITRKSGPNAESRLAHIIEQAVRNPLPDPPKSLSPALAVIGHKDIELLSRSGVGPLNIFQSQLPDLSTPAALEGNDVLNAWRYLVLRLARVNSYFAHYAREFFLTKKPLWTAA